MGFFVLTEADKAKPSLKMVKARNERGVKFALDSWLMEQQFF